MYLTNQLRGLGAYSAQQIAAYLLDNGIINASGGVIDAGRLQNAMGIYGWVQSDIDAAIAVIAPATSGTGALTPQPGSSTWTPEQIRDYWIARGWINMAGDVFDPHSLYQDAAVNGWSNAQIDAAMMTTLRFTNPGAATTVASPNEPSPAAQRANIDPAGNWNAQHGDILEDVNPRNCGAVPAGTGGLSSVTDVSGYAACRWTATVNTGLADGWVVRRSDLLRLTPAQVAQLPPAVINSSPTPMLSPAATPQAGGNTVTRTAAASGAIALPGDAEWSIASDSMSSPAFDAGALFAPGGKGLWLLAGAAALLLLRR